ncbi:hypothetical protein F4806DRAFT_177147 [Annulohypoxylon nitens]|nr:hypothetical protein F4806DRAFT_177147 [Annulohypoxylon nitens]
MISAVMMVSLTSLRMILFSYLLYIKAGVVFTGPWLFWTSRGFPLPPPSGKDRRLEFRLIKEPAVSSYERGYSMSHLLITLCGRAEKKTGDFFKKA